MTAERLLRFVSGLRSEVPGAGHEGLLIAYRAVLLNAMEHGAGQNASNVVARGIGRAGLRPAAHGLRPGAPG